MTELIKVEEREGIQTVNARALHEFLESKARFSDWIKSRIEKYEFIENVDYTKVSEIIDTIGGKQNGISFYISIDMAKELSMVENNDRGREARQYFIAMEKRAKQIHQLTEEEVLRNAFLILDNRVKKLEAEREENKPKIEFFHDVTGSKDAIEMSKVAKLIDCGMGRNKLFQFLRESCILRENNEPYQKYIDAGWFRVIEQKYEKSPGETRISIKTLVYQKGVDAINRLIKKPQSSTIFTTK